MSLSVPAVTVVAPERLPVPVIARRPLPDLVSGLKPERAPARVITVPVDVATLAAFPRQLRSKDRGPVWQFQPGPRELYRVND